MPPPLLYDLSQLDVNHVAIPLEEIRKILPHRFEMELLSGIFFDNGKLAVGYKDFTTDEFWVRGHIPERPLLPGVLMIECAAQLCAYSAMRQHPEMGFVGFAKCDEVRFRGTVIPPARLYMVAEMVELNRRRAIARCQGIHNGQMVFEAVVTGMSV